MSDAPELLVPSLTNITVYRATPLRYPGLADKNSGDAAGDLKFGLWELMMPMECRMEHRDPNAIGCQNGTGKYILNPNETIVYLQLTVETNALFGTYRECNPEPSGPHEGEFRCDPRIVGDGNGTHCRCARPGPDCGCANMKQRAVGKDHVSSGGGGGSGAGCAARPNRTFCNSECFCRWNQQDDICAPWSCNNNTQRAPCLKENCNGGQMCLWETSTPQPYEYAYPEFTRPAAAPGKCVAMDCSKRNHNKTACESSFTCSWVGTGCTSGGGGGGTIVDYWRGDLDAALHGHWYSTQAAGEAVRGGPSRPAWRVAAVDAVKMKECVDDAMVGPVHSRNASCFARCGTPHDKSSDCYIRCLFEGLLGNGQSIQPLLLGLPYVYLSASAMS